MCLHICGSQNSSDNILYNSQLQHEHIGQLQHVCTLCLLQESLTQSGCLFRPPDKESVEWHHNTAAWAMLNLCCNSSRPHQSNVYASVICLS